MVEAVAALALLTTHFLYQDVFSKLIESFIPVINIILIRFFSFARAET